MVRLYQPGSGISRGGLPIATFPAPHNFSSDVMSVIRRFWPF
jgi:hypothetical protein